MHNRVYDYWLVTTEGFGCKSYMRLLQRGVGGEEIFHMSEKSLAGLKRDGVITEKIYDRLNSRRKQCSEGQIAQEYELVLKRGISFCIYGEKVYPKRLMHIQNPPLILYYRGSLPKEESLAVAVIGARDCSDYGAYVARELGKELAKQGVAVVSGMARGIDGISQRSAAEYGGDVFAVLGSGVDICYPEENRMLYEQLCRGRNQGVISEYAPKTTAKASLFPPRNRIISGFSDVIVVVEARLKSGTLITVDMALEQGKEVYVVPGRITDRLSDGCNKLIREGAIPFLSPHDFAQELLCKREIPMPGGGQDRMPRKGSKELSFEEEQNKRRTRAETGMPAGTGEMAGAEELTETERAVYAHMDIEPKSVDYLMGRIGKIELKELLCALAMLQLKGLVGVRGNAYYRVLG